MDDVWDDTDLDPNYVPESDCSDDDFIPVGTVVKAEKTHEGDSNTNCYYTQTADVVYNPIPNNGTYFLVHEIRPSDFSNTVAKNELDYNLSQDQTVNAFPCAVSNDKPEYLSHELTATSSDFSNTVSNNELDNVSQESTVCAFSNSVLNDETDYLSPELTDSSTSDPVTNNTISGYQLPEKYVRRKHVCVFCGVQQAKLKRHIMSKHSDEKEAIPLINASSQKQAQSELEKLRNAGNHKNNIEVIQSGSGEIVIKRRKRTMTTMDSVVPCVKCLGWYAKKDLWRHKCIKKDQQSVPKRKAVQEGSLLIPQASVNSNYNEILEAMKKDNIYLICKNDDTIRLLGQRETNKNGYDRDRHGYIRNRLRELARLLIELRKLPGCKSSGLSDFLKPSRFSDVVNATKAIAEYSPSTGKYGIPSLAMKIGHSLMRCCILLKAKSLEENDVVLRETSQQYKEVHEIRWEQEISTHASRTLCQQKMNGEDTMPLSEDITALSKFLKGESEKIQEELSACTADDIKMKWERLTMITLASVILFNRRRQGEASKMKVSDYQKAINNTQHNVNVLSSLSEFEKALCRNMTRVQIVGKRGRIVPVILPKTTKKAMDILLAHRENAGVAESNTYMFARNNNESHDHIRGCDSLRNVAKEASLKHPEKLKSTGLRKHIATMSQLVSLQDNELDIVAQYLGHDIRTHREYYRLPTSTIQVAKVSKLLLSMEKGEAQCPEENDDSEDEDGDADHMTTSENLDDDHHTGQFSGKHD